jgi:hypothetical protein
MRRGSVLFVAGTALLTAASNASSDATKIGFRIVPGYAFGIGGQTVDETPSGEPVRLQMGAGLHPAVEIFTGLSRSFEIGLGLGYWRGSLSNTFSNVRVTSSNASGTATPTSYTTQFDNYQNSYSWSVLPVELALRGMVSLGAVRLFAGGSLGLYVPTDITQTWSYETTYWSTWNPTPSPPTKTSANATTSFSVAFGFGFQVGAELPLTDTLSLTAELRGNQVSFWPSKTVVHSTQTDASGSYVYTYDGTTNYVSSIPPGSDCRSTTTYGTGTTTYTTTCTPNAYSYQEVDDWGGTTNSTTVTESQNAVAQTPESGASIGFHLGLVIRL